MNLSPMSQAAEDLRKRAQIVGGPRAEAEAEMQDGRMQRQASSTHKGAYRGDLNIGSMQALRKGKRGRAA